MDIILEDYISLIVIIDFDSKKKKKNYFVWIKNFFYEIYV